MSERTQRLSATVIAAAFLCGISPAIAVGKPAAHAPQHYTLTDLGTLGGTTSAAVGLNNKGQVAGGSSLSGDVAFHAFLWNQGAMIDLGTLENWGVSTTFANPNQKGDVSGMANLTISDPNGEDFCFFSDQLECVGFLWQEGALATLPTLGGNNSLAYMLNDLDHVAGVAENTTQDPTCTPYNLEAKPVVWHNAAVQELPTIAGDPDGFAYGINNQGQIVGSTGACNAQVPATSLHAVLWPNGPNGGVIDLGNFGGSMWNVAFYINSKGQIVGQAGVPDGINFHAFLWQNGVMTDLGILPGDAQSWANNINNKNQAVGTSFSANSARAFIWQNGAMTDLNTLIPANSPLYLLEAFGINDRGQISGFGILSDGELRAYRLTPCNNGDKGCGGGDSKYTVPQTNLPSHELPNQASLPPWLRAMNRLHGWPH